MADRATVLEARDIVVGGGRILDGASIAIHEGEVATLTGASGSGKSTMLRVLAMLALADAGEVSLRGERAEQLAPESYRRRVGYVAQGPAMLAGTVADNVRRGPALAGESLDDAAVASLLDRVGLSADLTGRPASDLSGGERVRVAIARALALSPEVLLLDEPTAALDRASAERVLDLIVSLSDAGAGVLVVTHAIEDAARLGGVGWRCESRTIRRREVDS